jgi:alanyl-tRNA synthetase
MKTAADIRRLFLSYFTGRGHTVVPSSSLIPFQDPTLLFTNAGMVQFKNVFTGRETASYTRAASSQKCMRAGGKHNDLENVGRTARHHTFFEMLGNFSFGDYFKRDAIAMGWEFLTSTLRLDADRLWVSVFRDDDEAFEIWHRQIGISTSRIVRLGAEDNFWSMGETGPCGPCSEIILDQGTDVGCGKPGCAVGCSCDRFLELWNLVFMQFNRDGRGEQTPLPRPCIDTGMGLERIAAVVQGVRSNYQSDLFQPLLRQVESLCGCRYGDDDKADISMRVIVDHLRAITFLITDGVIPSNEGRGYVLRRIIRRAARHGKKLNVNGPFLSPSCAAVAQVMGDAYAELLNAQGSVAKVVLAEEERFAETLDGGLHILQEEVKTLRRQGLRQLSGEVSFRLYDTYGFPLDLTSDIVAEEGLTVDEAGFHTAMDEQRERARKSWKGSRDEAVDALLKGNLLRGLQSVFTGYESTEAAATATLLLKDGTAVDSAGAGDTILLLTDTTPFYGESGGQAGDTGVIERRDLTAVVQDTIRPLPEIILHRVHISHGTLSRGDALTLKVDSGRRAATAANHTATHLLQASLREVLGDHVKQSGSLVTPERFRFDFTHYSALTGEELERVEALVNRRVRGNHPVHTSQIPYQQALQAGAMALFGEKYGDTVRMVTINSVSNELCGGTHTKRSGDIGLVKILAESSVAAGIRRIEAVTGEEAARFIKEEEQALLTVRQLIKAQPDEIVPKISKLLDDYKKLQKEVETIKKKISAGTTDLIVTRVREIKGVKVIAAPVDAHDAETLREQADRIRDQIKSGIIIVGTTTEEKALLVVVVTKDLIPLLHAGKIIQQVVKVIGGSGGGRPDMAQAGGKEKDRLMDALGSAYDIIERMMP